MGSAALIQSAFSVRPRCAELLQCEVSVKEICLNRGYYTVDVTYFYKVTGEVFPSNHTVDQFAVSPSSIRHNTFSSTFSVILIPILLQHFPLRILFGTDALDITFIP